MYEPILKHIFAYPSILLCKDFILAIITNIKLPDQAYFDDPAKQFSHIIYPGKLFHIGDNLSFYDGEQLTKLVKYNEDKRPYAKFEDIIDIEYRGKVITTTLGRYILNYALVMEPFGERFDFINESWNASAYERDITNAFLEDEITISQIKHYLKNLHFLRAYGELANPPMSADAIRVDPKVIELRDKLLEKHKHELDDPEVMLKIQREVIALDKKLIQQNPDNKFLNSAKNFNVHRRAMFIMTGMVPAFGDDKDFNFIPTSLNEGWSKEYLDKLFNEPRSGAFGRAKETAAGGEDTKWLLRAFQECKITEDDCGTSRGVMVTITEDMLDKNNTGNVLYKHIVINGRSVLVKDFKGKLTGQTVKMRMPRTCTTVGGYCFKCLDYRMKKVGMTKLATSTISVSKTFMMLSMKKMHGTSADAIRIDSASLKKYCQ